MISFVPKITRPGFASGLVCCLAMWLAALPCRAIVHEADVCVYGGTSAGVVAAIQTAKMGRSVVLVEPSGHFGGMSIEGLGGTDIDNHAGFQNSPAVGGLALEFYRRVAARYGRAEVFEDMLRHRRKQRDLWRFEPHVAESVFAEWLKEKKIKTLPGHRLREKNGVQKDGARIVALHFENGDEIRARMFIDASYEGDMLAAADVSTTLGREGNARYGETKNGVQTSSPRGVFDRKIDPYREPGNPESGLIFGVQDEPIGNDGDASDGIQAFCFRLCLTKNPGNRIPIEKPANYDPAHYELQRRYIAAGGKITPPWASLPNGKTDPGSWHRLAGNMPGFNDLYPVASHAERTRMLRENREYIQGLYWFLANDPAVPAGMRNAWSQWGLCKDEFTDNNGWPRTFYARNGRRMVSDYVITEYHGRKINPLPVEDPVALCWWPHDMHEARRLVRDGVVWLEGIVFDSSKNCDWTPFGISYRALVPRRAECVNLLTPTCPSSSYVAYGACRIEYQFMSMAQAAATAAVHGINENAAVQDVDYSCLKQRLLQDGQVLEPPRVAATAEVRDFIRNSWAQTFRHNEKNDDSLIGLPKPYTVPSIAGNFQEMYYWDTYFTGEGLILDGHVEMAANNIENMVYLTGLYGKMLNGNRTHFENRSQPPYLSMMIESVYKKTGDKEWLKKILPGLRTEYHFWMTRRLTPCGLNRYSNESTLANRERIVGILAKRLGANYKAQTAGFTAAEISKAGSHFIAEAESGWDFTPRFQMRCEDFCPVDLNANLYYYEKNFEYFYNELGNATEAKAWASKAAHRKELIRKYCRDAETGLYYDYDFVNNRRSDVVSAAVFSLLYAKAVEPHEAAMLKEKALSMLEYPHGIATCADRDYGYTYQWSFPNAWAPLQYLCIRGLDNYGHRDDARRIAQKYVTMVAKTYKTTGNLWEKYNAVEGNVNVTNEYKLPAMIGWTAGIFVWADEFLKQ